MTLTSQRFYPALFALWITQGVIALLWLLLLPSDTGGFSASRLLLMGLAFALALASTVLWNQSRTGTWPDLTHRIWLSDFIYLLALLAFLLPPTAIIILRALGQTVSFTYTAYAQRLAPLAFWFSLSGLEWCIWHLFTQKQILQQPLAATKPLFRFAFYFLLIILFLVILILTTGWGISPTRDGSFGNPPTPLLEWQLALAILVGASAMLNQARWNLKRLDLVIFLVVYLSTCLLWLSDPLIPGYFATPPRSPNYEPYPFSDALIYAQYAQSALVGEGLLWPDIPTRPFYVALLVWMHALVGQNYYHVIILQIILLAFFPATLYLLGRELGSRPLGLMLALLAALRDLTTNHAAPFALNYSYSKVFFSEIPTALLLTIFTILAMRWIKSQKPAWYLLMTGGLLGVAALVRLQSAVLLAPLAIVTLFPLWKMRRGEWLRGLALMTLGVLLTLTPWLIRNTRAAGGLVLDNPISQSMVLARRWSGDNGNELIPQKAGETAAQYSSRMTAIALDNLKREPGRILSGAANHFFNNLITSLLVMPIRDQLKSPAELLWPEHAFWQTGVRSPLLSTFYILLFALGLAAAWTSNRWAGLLPLGLSLGYHGWTALFLSSGDRFLIPIDWTWYLYHAWGLLMLAKLAMLGLRGNSLERQPALNNGDKGFGASKIPAWGQVTLTAAVILLVGASLPLSEVVFPEKYPSLTQEQLSTQLGMTPQAGEIVVYGRAIYPRYYEAGEGEPGTAKLGYGASDEARLVFWLVGPQSGLVIVPLENAPTFFPHAADVWIAGRLDDDVLRARVVKVEQDAKSILYVIENADKRE